MLARSVITSVFNTVLVGSIPLATACSLEGENDPAASAGFLARSELPPTPVAVAGGASVATVHSEDESILELPAPTPRVVVRWPSIIPGEAAELDAATTLIEIRNPSQDESVDVELSWVGDVGTSRSYAGELDAVSLAAGEMVELEVDLGTLLPTLQTTYSGYLHVVARPSALDVDFDQVISPGIYFHQDEAGVLAYDETVLRRDFGAGDFQGLMEPAEEGDALTRILQHEDVAFVVGESPLASSTTVFGASPLDVPSQSSGSLAVAPQFSYSQTLCTNFAVQTSDSGYVNSVGIDEDYWANANSGISTLGYGVRVKVGSTTYNTSSTGCVTFTSPGSSYTADVTVYTWATDANGNLIRLHDGLSDSQDTWPGSTYYAVYRDVAFTSGVTKTLLAGGYTVRWTAMAALAHSLTFYNEGLSNTEIHVSDLGGENPNDPVDCASNYTYYQDTTNNEGYIRLVTASGLCSPHSQRHKFVLAHEYGHVYGFQRANVVKQLPEDETRPDSPMGTAGTCAFGAGYGNTSKEYSSVASREGFAHFVSARIWNDASADGQFRWDSNWDLERWNATNDHGGRLVGTCCPGSSMSCAASLDGAGVITDWMRAFWDIHTDSTCSFDKDEMGEFYDATIQLGGLTDENLFEGTEGVAAILGCGSRWTWIGCVNGVDREGATWGGC